MSAIALAEAKQHLPEIVERYLAGESMQTLAKECGVHRQRLYEWMLADAGPEQYEASVTQVLVRRVSEADAALEDPAIEPDTARAHARARFARMDLERRRPHLYGQRQQLDVTHHGPLVQITISAQPEANSLIVE